MCYVWAIFSRVLLVLFLLLPYITNSQDFASKEYYLIDSLILDELVESDRNLLDSCLSLYHESTNSLDKIKALDGICAHMGHKAWEQYQYFQLDLIRNALKVKQARETSSILKKSLADALNNVGVILNDKGASEEAISLYKESLRIRKELGDHKGIANSLNNLAHIFWAKGDLKEAINYGNRSLKISEKNEDKINTAHSLIMLGSIHRQKGDLVKSLDCINRSLKIRTDLGDKYGMAESLNNMGSLYTAQKDTIQALKLYRRSLRYFRDIGNKMGEAGVLVNIGDIFEQQRNYSEAIRYFENGLEIFERLNQKTYIVDALNAMGELYYNQVNYYEATSVSLKSLHLSEEIDYKNGVSRSMVNLARVYQKKEMLDSAYYYAKRSFLMSKGLGFQKRVADASNILSEVYESQGNTGKALKMHRIYVQVKDSLNQIEFAKKLEGIQYEYELEKQNQEIKLLNREKELSKVKFRMSLILYVIGIIVLVFVGVFWFRRKRRKYEKELNELRTLKLQEDAQESHEEISSILVKRGRKLSSVELTDIICFRGESNYVLLIDRKGTEYIVDYTLTKLEEILPINFVRIHRSSIINKDEISAITKGNRSKHTFTMNGESGMKIFSSEGYAKVAKNIVEEFKSKSL